MSLRQILAANLPRLAYVHDNATDIAAAPFRPITSDTGWVKPNPGTGLWTAPVTRTNADGAPADTEWLAYCRDEMNDTDGCEYLTEIVPAVDARVLLIDSLPDLVAIVDEFPASNRFLVGLADRYPDWSAIAGASWDAVYLTDRGQWETRLPPRGPNLYGWDIPSVLWLNPAFSVGRTVEVPKAVSS